MVKMTENACQTSLDNLSTEEEIHKLKEENFILKGKLRGYKTLAEILREKKEECSKLQKMNEELQKQKSPGAGSFSQDNVTQSHLINGEITTNNTNPGGVKEQSIISENIDVSLKSGHTTEDITDPFNTEHNKTQNGKMEATENISWAEQFSGVAYPPTDIFKQIKTDKYPTQESISLTSNDIKKENTLLSQKAVPVTLSDSKNPLNKDSGGVVRSTSTVVQIGSDSSSKSLNLMEFPPDISKESSNKDSTSKFKVVTASSSQSSSIQILKPSFSRQGSKSETALSLHVSELVNGDLGTDGPTSKMKKMLEDILPDLTRIEEENETLKNDNKGLRIANSHLLKKLQHLELQINNLSPADSLSSQTQILDWEYINKSDLHKSKTTEKELTQKTEDISRLINLEQQNKELLQANSRWERMFKEMRNNQEKITKDHQSKVEILQEQITKTKTEDEKRRREFDHILLTTKNRLEDTEAAKEAVQAQLAEFQESYEQLQQEKRQLEESVNLINREQLAREAELSVLRQGMGGESIQAIHHSSDSDLRTEIAVLREQLTLFQEDFDRERQDRAKAQSEKDDLQNQLGKLRAEKHKLLDQNKRYLAQLQTAEVNVKEAIEESTRLNSTNVELRNKIRQLESQAISRPPQFNPNITAGRQGAFPTLMVQPETDPYARPSPPYLFHTPLNAGNLQSNRERYPSEQQPGAWNCDDCTYSNHPSRTVCEMCGKIRTQGSPAVQNSSPSPPLYRRGENGEQNDLASD